MGRIVWLIFIAAWWTMSGAIAQDVHYGAEIAGVWGWFHLAALTFLMVVGAPAIYDESEIPRTRALTTNVAWASLPFNLVSWGDGGHGIGDVFESTAWFVGAAFVIFALTWVSHKASEPNY